MPGETGPGTPNGFLSHPRKSGGFGIALTVTAGALDWGLWRARLNQKTSTRPEQNPGVEMRPVQRLDFARDCTWVPIAGLRADAIINFEATQRPVRWCEAGIFRQRDVLSLGCGLSASG